MQQLKGQEMPDIPCADLFSRMAALTGAVGEPVHFTPGENLIEQYHPAEDFLLLRDGRVAFQMHRDGEARLPVGEADATGLPVGWSGLRPPLRYPTTVTAVADVTAHRWPLHTIQQALDSHPEKSLWLLEHCLTHARRLLDQTRHLVCETTGHGRPGSAAAPPREVIEPTGRFHPLSLLQRAAFFEGLAATELRRLAKCARLLQYRRGETLLEEGVPGPGLLLLMTGQVSLHRQDRSKKQILLRSLSLCGQVTAWTGITGSPENDVTAIATKPSQLYLLPQSEIAALLNDDPALHTRILRRLLWLVGNHLRSARAMLLSRQETREIPAVRNLIEQSSPELRVTSTLHKVPHLLEDRLTLGDAFAYLERLQADGEGIETRLANLCLDLLHDTRREWDFFSGLQRIYDSVVNAPPDRTPKQLRILCAEAFAGLFHNMPQFIGGMENLPKKPGHIIIMNHLSNHPANTLPNGFQMTLDSHFVASMVLHRRYGDPGVRVVRYGSGAEHGHQRYYERLGHLHVYTADSGIVDAERIQTSRSSFFDHAADVIRSGINLVICPEGSSGPTGTSPRRFKTGAFSLAASLQPEPLIVPIAVANFDHPLGSQPFAVAVQPPFRLSARLADTGDTEAMTHFLDELQRHFRQQVRRITNMAHP